MRDEAARDEAAREEAARDAAPVRRPRHAGRTPVEGADGGDVEQTGAESTPLQTGRTDGDRKVTDEDSEPTDGAQESVGTASRVRSVLARVGGGSRTSSRDLGDRDWQHDPLPHVPGRNETPNQRADRNFSELLQELRVLQTGVQILTGFLLTLPFQARFEELDSYQRTLYLILVSFAVITTGVILGPVSAHRALFHRGLKPTLVQASNALARLALLLLSLTVTGTVMLAFDVVLSRRAGWVAGSIAFVALLTLWWIVPRLLSRKRPVKQPGHEDDPEDDYEDAPADDYEDD